MMQFCKNTNIETVISYTLRCHAMLKNRCNDDPDVEHRLVLEKRGVYDKATEQYKSALRVRLSLFGRKHVSVAESMNAVGVMTHHHLKVRVIRSCPVVWISESSIDLCHFGTIFECTYVDDRGRKLLYSNSLFTRSLQDLDGAWKLLKEALETQGALLDTGHSDTAKTSKNIIALYRGGLHTHNRRTLGENHPETIATTRHAQIHTNIVGESAFMHEDVTVCLNLICSHSPRDAYASTHMYVITSGSWKQWPNLPWTRIAPPGVLDRSCSRANF